MYLYSLIKLRILQAFQIETITTSREQTTAIGSIERAEKATPIRPWASEEK